SIAAIKAETVLIVADTGELQVDWLDGGRLDLIQDIIAADTTTDIPATIATLQSDSDKLTGADGATLATAQGLYAPLKPTTVGRTLDVTAAGEAGIDLDNAVGTLDASEIGVDAIGSSELADSAAQEIWNVICEDQGGGYTCREAISVMFGGTAGTAVYTAGTRTYVISDPSGTETRITLIYGTDLDGDRTSSIPVPMTP
ncbi:hypothetical protein LCGC14_2608780, partial [marine sediment metagenome]